MVRKLSLLIITLCSITTSIALAENKEKNQKIPNQNRQLINNGFADIVEELLPTVVNLTTSQNYGQDSITSLTRNEQFESFKNQVDGQFEPQRKKSNIGSGFIISKDGYIITNQHVINEAKEVTAKLHDGKKYKAKVIGADKKTDLALLKIDGEQDFEFVKIGNSDKARIGDWVIVIGNPYGLGSSVSIGIISARSRDIDNNGQNEELIQTDAAINKGNSGGPMFDLNGEVIGISTSLFSPSGGSVGIGFATPINNASQIIKQLKEEGSVSRGWIGVSVQDVTDEISKTIKSDKVKGAFVIDVLPNSPAERSGIEPTDIIIKLDNQEVYDMKSLPKIISKTPIGKVIKVTIIRQNKIKTLDVVVEKLKEEEFKKSAGKTLSRKNQNTKKSNYILGMEIIDSTDKNLDKGITINNVSNISEAFKKGIISGDKIMSANQVPINSFSELRNVILESKKSNNKIFLFIKRSEKNYAIALSTN